ncbi:MAG: HlyD family efflux transporter periplasmic adaptor subunit [Stenomitos rutilans HA7619-LM2]|nr:HlyD family efflux transporter periplasmic adaptor subunit [Stenomitos rutilans HA7619-LM2]
MACDLLEPKASQTVVQAAPVAAVVALGRLEPDGEVIKLSVPNAQDSRVNRILVKEGDHVQSGQLIALLQGIDRRQADVQDAKADVRLQQATLTKVRQGDAKQAQITAQQATIARLEAQLKTETQQRQAAIASASATLRNAALTYQRRQALQQEGAIARADLDTAQREWDTARAELAERQAALQQTLTTVSAEIVQERARLAELREVRPVDLQIAAAQLEKAEIAVQQRQALLEDVQVRAPISGQILRINTRIGEQVNTAQGIMELARTEQMVVTAEIAEIDVGKIHNGQRAIITSEYGGFIGEVHGTIAHISLQVGRRSLQDANAVNSPTTDSNARVIAVKIRIDPKDNAKVASFTNMQVRVKLTMEKRQANR